MLLVITQMYIILFNYKSITYKNHIITTTCKTVSNIPAPQKESIVLALL